jgi:hypothetical protein
LHSDYPIQIEFEPLKCNAKDRTSLNDYLSPEVGRQRFIPALFSVWLLLGVASWQKVPFQGFGKMADGHGSPSDKLDSWTLNLPQNK